MPIESAPWLKTAVFSLRPGVLTVEPSDGSLQSLRVDFRENGKLVFPVGESGVVLVRRADVIGSRVFVFVQGVVVRSAMNVDMMFRYSRYLLCRVGVVAVTVLHRCLLIIYMLI